MVHLKKRNLGDNESNFLWKKKPLSELLGYIAHDFFNKKIETLYGKEKYGKVGTLWRYSQLGGR
jgi:hypothetical protein